MKVAAVVAALGAVFAISTRGQEFQNLNFESAYNLPGDPGEHGMPVATTNALPGWSAYGGPELADVYYVSNSFPGASTLVELEGGSLALSGNFSVGLYGGGWITQTGFVPDNAESLQFEASSALDLEVTLGAQNLSYSEISKGSGYAIFGANIASGLSGQVETLSFIGGEGILLDNIQFSTSSVPERGECGLVGLGAVLFGVFRRRRDGIFNNKETKEPSGNQNLNH